MAKNKWSEGRILFPSKFKYWRVGGKKNKLLLEIKTLEEHKASLHSSLHGPLEDAVRNLKDDYLNDYIDIMGSSFAALDNHPYVAQHKNQWPEHFLQFVGLAIKLTGEAVEKNLDRSSDSD